MKWGQQNNPSKPNYFIEIKKNDVGTSLLQSRCMWLTGFRYPPSQVSPYTLQLSHLQSLSKTINCKNIVNGHFRDKFYGSTEWLSPIA